MRITVSCIPIPSHTMLASSSVMHPSGCTSQQKKSSKITLNIPSVPSFSLPNACGKSAHQKVRFGLCIHPVLPPPSLSLPISLLPIPCSTHSRKPTCEHHCILHPPLGLESVVILSRQVQSGRARVWDGQDLCAVEAEDETIRLVALIPVVESELSVLCLEINTACGVQWNLIYAAPREILTLHVHVC
jgi:hypothetical protein